MLKKISFTVCFFHLLNVGFSQDTLTPEVAQFLAEDGFGTRNQMFLTSPHVMLMDEANIRTYNTFRDLEANGYVSMALVDSSYCCSTYGLTFLPASQVFVTDVYTNELGAQTVVKTMTCDSIVVLDVTDFSTYYEIKFQVVNPVKTMFYPLNPTYGPDPDAIIYTSCFVRNVAGVWQIDDDNRFQGFSNK